MTKSESYVLFKFIGNSFNESRLLFTNGNPHYFQNQCHYHSVSFCPVLSHSVPFIFSRKAISLMPAMYSY
jgi:hypothetical protein